MLKNRFKNLSPENEELIRTATIWGYISGGIFGFSGFPIIFYWMGNEILFGLVFWGIFSVGFFVLVIGGVQIGKKTPSMSKRKLKMRAQIRGMFIGIVFGIMITIIILILFLLIGVAFS